MIEPHWKRIAGLHVENEGEIAAVWFAHDRDGDIVVLYDACIFRREVPAVIAEGLNARGRWIPIAWEKGSQEFADDLLKRGVHMMPEPVKETDALREVRSREIWERIRTHRFNVDKRLVEWWNEYNAFFRTEGQVPKEGFPFMSATRYAIIMLPHAKAQRPKGKQPENFKRVAIV